MKDADVIKPSFYSIFAGAFFTIFSVIVLFFLQSSLNLGMLFYILAFLVLLAATKKNVFTIFYLAVISAIVNIILGVLRVRARREQNVTGGFSNMILGFIGTYSWLCFHD